MTNLSHRLEWVERAQCPTCDNFTLPVRRISTCGMHAGTNSCPVCTQRRDARFDEQPRPGDTATVRSLIRMCIDG